MSFTDIFLLLIFTVLCGILLALWRNPGAARAHRPRHDGADARFSVAPARGVTSPHAGSRGACCFKPDATERSRARERSRGGSGPAPRGYWCAACQTRITDEDAALEVAGAHFHRFLNPAGVSFDIACFREARCSVEGAPSLDATWFPGLSWSFANCANCGEHLGWAYDEAGSIRFFGLIRPRLIGPL